MLGRSTRIQPGSTITLPNPADVQRNLDAGKGHARAHIIGPSCAQRPRLRAPPTHRRRHLRRRPSPERLHEARNSAERIELAVLAMHVKFPDVLAEPCDFEAFADVVITANEYIDSAFACITDHPLPSGAVPEPPCAAEARLLRHDMLQLAAAFNEYWMVRADEMLVELDLSADDASADRMSTDLMCMTVIALAEATALALGEFASFARATALSYPSVQRQLIAQTARPIRDYGPADLVRALDALCHAWQRVRLDDDVYAYVHALRLRFGVMMRCASIRPPDAPPLAPADAALLTDPCVLADGSEARLPTLEFRQEMTHRFRALADARWIFAKHGPAWSHADLHTALRRRAGVDTGAEFDPARGAAEVATLLAEYTALVKGSGEVSQRFRSSYMEFMVGPGDDGVFRTRNPNVGVSTKNVVKDCRGGKFLATASTRSTYEAHEILAAVAQRMCGGVFGAAPYDECMNDRSRAWMHEEIAAVCAFDCLVKGRYSVAWRDRFIVARGTYRAAEELGFLDADALPLLLVSANAFDLLCGGRILRVTSVFEAIAWWLEAMRLAHASELPASVALFKGIIAAKRDQACGQTASAEPEVAEPIGPPKKTRAVAVAVGDTVAQRIVMLSDEIRRRATRIDLSDLCNVPTRGAQAMQLRTNQRQQCTDLGSGVFSF